jgi:hypothetical protein
LRRIIVLALVCLGAGAIVGQAGAATSQTSRSTTVVRSLTGSHVWTRISVRGIPSRYILRNYDIAGRPLGVRTGRLALVGPKYATGKGRVFDPNPVVALNDETLTDQKDTDYAALQPAYVVRKLTNLDGSGFLRGPYANVGGTTSDAFDASLNFQYTRSDDRFEQTQAYFAVNSAQEYIHSLGFTNVNREPQNVKIDQWGIDNSAYYPNADTIKFGKGDVDDAEDEEVIWHEYGHAIQDAQVKGYGTTLESGSIGEGFGDYWAFTMSEPNNRADPACIADWDSTGYTAGPVHCLRRVDMNLHWPENDGNEVHRNGRIWSRALFDIHNALGRTPADRIVLESQFSYTPDESFAAASNAAIAAARSLYGAKAAQICHDAFAARGFIQ